MFSLKGEMTNGEGAALFPRDEEGKPCKSGKGSLKSQYAMRRETKKNEALSCNFPYHDAFQGHAGAKDKTTEGEKERGLEDLWPKPSAW